jgi:hypothetical protein
LASGPKAWDQKAWKERAMRFLLVHYVDEAVEFSTEGLADQDAALASWIEETSQSGVKIEGHRLQPVSDATTVRVRDGQVLVSDGPFAETKEQIAGYDIVECLDLQHALDVASRHPTVQIGTIAVRPFLRT